MTDWSCRVLEEHEVDRLLAGAYLCRMAMAAAAALDTLHIEGIVGSIAGDDTIMCAISNEQETVRVMERLNRLLNERT